MYFLFDIGGTKTKFAISSDGILLDKHLIFNTPENFEEAMQFFENAFKEITEGQTVQLSAGGVRSLSFDKTTMMQDFKLPSWEAKPLKERLEKITGTKVFLENDTVLSGLGEAIYGAGKGYSVVAYLTLSTGVNAVRLIDGRIDEKSAGSEIGHTIVDMDYSLVPSAKQLRDKGYGQLESYTSGGALTDITGLSPSEIKDEDVWIKLYKALAAGIINTTLYWLPDMLIIGGSLGNSEKISLEKIEKYIKEYLTREVKLPKIEKSQLLDLNGLWGALGLLKSKTS